jgi:hypothetical protein
MHASLLNEDLIQPRKLEMVESPTVPVAALGIWIGTRMR